MKRLLSCILLSCALFAAGAETLSLDEAIALSSKKIAASLQKGTRVAVLNCTSSSAKLSEYVVQEIIFSLVESRSLVIVERDDVQLVKNELQFQLSGDVSDESAQSIGKLLGAQVIVTCSIDGFLNFRVKAIAVETAQLLAVSSLKILNEGKLESLSENLVLVMDCDAGGAGPALAATISSIMMSAVSGAPGFRAVSGESRAKALAESTNLSRIGKMTEANTVLTGKLSVEGGLWYLTVTLVSVETGTVLSGSTESYRSSGTAAEGARGQVLRCLGVQAATDDRRVITVSNMTELLQAVGSDRIIRVRAGSYDLTGGYQVKNKNITWVDEYDGPCPVIKSVSNMALIGEGDATIMITPAYGWVLSFDTCTGIKISGLVLGHTVPGECMGGVLRFKNCDDTEIRSCELYGSGTYGLGLERSSGFVMEDCVVRDCTFGLATIDGSNGVSFTDTVFRDTGEYDLFEIKASDHIVWTDCLFDGNAGNTLFYLDGESRDLRLVRCGFSNNDVDTFSNRPRALALERPMFDGNRFKVDFK